jgi:hypothetical protein
VSSAPSCPPPDLAPAVLVDNLSPRNDPDRPPDSVMARLSTMEALHLRGDALEREARAEATRGIANGRITVSFRPARSVGVGDYAGLAADLDGVFHALWIDRRNGRPELYTARIALAEAERGPAGTEVDVTDRVEIITGPATFDPARGIIRFPIELRNVSTEPIAGPIALRVVGVKAVAGRPSATVTDSSGRVGAPIFSFAGRIGSDDVLEPLDRSEPVVVTLRTQAGTGWDASLDVRVTGRLRR